MANNETTRWTGGLVLALALLLAVALPAAGAAKEHEKAEMMPAKANHFKCYDILDWADWDPKYAALADQFGKSEARVVMPSQLCNPVDKNGEGIPDPKYHLVCFTIRDDPQGNTPRVKEVMVSNQFYEGPLWVGSADLVCVPSMKSYQAP